MKRFANSLGTLSFNLSFFVNRTKSLKIAAVILGLASTSISFGMTYKNIESGDYNNCEIWSIDCAPDRILFDDTVLISHEVMLTNDIVVEGVLIIDKDALFYGYYKITVAETGILINEGTIDLEIEEKPIYFVPNSFTPNSDEYNNDFSPVFVSGFEPDDYNLTIYNRSGKVIFESNDATYGWDGTFSGIGLIQSGTYLWKIEFQESMSAKRHRIMGHVNLVL